MLLLYVICLVAAESINHSLVRSFVLNDSATSSLSNPWLSERSLFSAMFTLLRLFKVVAEDRSASKRK